MFRPVLLLSLTAALAFAAAPARAQDPPAAASSAPESKSPLSWWWQHSTPVPIVFYTPENQLGFGAGVMTTWFIRGAFADRPSNVILYGIYTTRKQTILGASQELHFADDRHVFLQDLRYIDWPDRFYGIGNATRASDRENYTDHYAQLETEYDLRLVSRLYAGVRHQFRASQTQQLEADGVLASERPLGVGSVLFSGVGPVLLWDTREGLFWPRGGSLLRADVTLHRPWLGADFSAELLRADLRHYQPLWFGHVLAMRIVMQGVMGEPPFQLLPSLGGSSLFRGWFLGRLRDRVLAASELEYRAPLTERWSMVGFGSLGRVAPRFAALDPRSLRAAGGIGVRFALRPENRANFRLDVAYGDELYVYFQFREAY